MKIYGDHLNRIQTVEDIIQIIKECTAKENPTTFSVEGEWGRGKTWLIDKVESALRGIDISSADGVMMSKHSDKEYLVFKYNAWEKDYYNEPLLAILITLVNQLNKELFWDNLLKSELKVLYDETKETLEEALRSISKRVIGVDVVNIGKQSIQIFKKVKEKAKIELDASYSENIEKDIKTVVMALNRLSKQVSIVFVVDALDRCIPSHSIKTLERLHHIFGKVQSTVTVISVNEKQLKNTVELMFGKNISFETYMRKFLDFRINLNAGYADVDELHVKLEKYFSLFMIEGDKSLQDEIISNVCGFMTAREFETVYKNAMTCHNLVGKSSCSFSRDCALAEILLFACKIAIEKENSRASIMPMYGNTPQTNLGLYIKGFLRNMIRNMYLDLAKPIDLILYICANGLEIINEMQITYGMEDTDLLQEIECFYKEYTKFYKLIKI